MREHTRYGLLVMHVRCDSISCACARPPNRAHLRHRFRTNFMCARLCVCFEHKRFIFMMNLPGKLDNANWFATLPGVHMSACSERLQRMSLVAKLFSAGAVHEAQKFACTHLPQARYLQHASLRDSIILLRVHLLLHTARNHYLSPDKNKTQGASKPIRAAYLRSILTKPIRLRRSSNSHPIKGAIATFSVANIKIPSS